MATCVAAMEEKQAAMAVEKAARDAKNRKEIRLAGGKAQWERNQSRLRCGMTALPPTFRGKHAGDRALATRHGLAMQILSNFPDVGTAEQRRLFMAAGGRTSQCSDHYVQGCVLPPR